MGKPLYRIITIATEQLRDPDVKHTQCELFKVEADGITHPYRVRLTDTVTKEAGPQIMMFKKLSAAAKVFEEQAITW